LQHRCYCTIACSDNLLDLNLPTPPSFQTLLSDHYLL
tara:strand:- start:89888 stop:89998 length:111 start_codon:yes stop_codon:yes gene_type:complete